MNRRRKVKAWAVIDGGSVCYPMIFRTRRGAREWKGGRQLVPVTITYELPKRRRRAAASKGGSK